MLLEPGWGLKAKMLACMPEKDAHLCDAQATQKDLGPMSPRMPYNIV